MFSFLHKGLKRLPVQGLINIVHLQMLVRSDRRHTLRTQASLQFLRHAL